jgi:adenylate cyclase
VRITASGEQEKTRAIESGADDFVNKPFDQAELLARVRSLVRVKRYHDTIQHQAAELARWNRELEQRVQDQIEQLDRVSRLRRFLPAQLADLIISSGDESFLNPHRREITVVCCDLRGFTAFAEAAEPEDVWDILGSTTLPWATSSAASQGPWNGSPVMGSWSFSTIPSRATTRRCGPSGWR